MAENTRKDPRAKVLSMTVRYKSATLDEFIEHHSHDVSRGGMYIKTPQPFPPGTLLKFEVKIAADQKVMQGVGRVVWRRESDDASADHPAGMGVKFIKLDTESKDVIDQLVTARMGDISAFDEVEPASDGALSALAQAPAPTAAKDASHEGFFPKSTDSIPQPAPEDRTVMKQATELLQEALREVGRSTEGSTPTDQSTSEADPIPRAPRAASVTPSPARTARSGAQASADQSPRVQMPPVPAVSAHKSDVKSISAAAEPAMGAGGTPSRSATPVQVKKTPAPAATASESVKPADDNRQQRFEPVKPQSVPSVTAMPPTEAAPRTVPATPMAARRIAQASPAVIASAVQDEQKPPIRRAVPAGRGMRIGIILVVIGAAAAAVMALSRKPETAAPTPSPIASASAENVESAPVVLNLVRAVPEAGPAPSATAGASAAVSAAATKAAPVEKPAETTKPAASPAPKVRQVAPRHKRADAGAASAPTSESPDDLYPTSPPTKSGADTTGPSDTTPAPTTKSKSKTPAPAAPTATEEAPL